MPSVKRLVRGFKPASYKVDITLDAHSGKFSGTTIIEGDLINTSKSISVHGKRLNINSASIDGVSAKTRYDSQDELIIEADSDLSSGKHQVVIEYESEIIDTLHGLYKSTYRQDDKPAFVISTQLESHHAREVFPCIDEPEAKAAFDITISTDEYLDVLSNMPVKSQSTKQDLKTTSFEQTPVMSTYLVALAIGNFEHISKVTKKGVKLSVYTTPDHIKHADFALDVGVKALDFLTDYFEIDYPLPKCDFVAIPNFSAGAMENWGLITYRETALIVDEANTALSSKQRVAETIVHELAHQWFGNLVTMKWWNDLWLNEGFASWVANFGVDKLFPEWKYWSQFIASDFTAIQVDDALPSTRPIDVEINHPDEIRSLFDEISYLKGPVIVRMLHDYLGAEDFRKGISYYLNKFLYSNANTNDLWQALEDYSHKPVKEMMSSWTSMAGYPYIEAKVNSDSIELKQSQNLITGSVDESKVWPVPISASGIDEKYLLTGKSGTWDVKSSGDIKLNANQSGLYMVGYEPNHAKKLFKLIQEDRFNETDTLGLINDSMQLAKAGKGSALYGLELISRLGNNESLIVWGVIVSQLGSIRRAMDDEELIDLTRPFQKRLSKHNLDRLGWSEIDGESSFDKLMRPTILGSAAFGEDESVIEEGLKQFKSAKSPSEIAPDVRSVVYSVAAKHLKNEAYDKILKFYRAESSPQEERRLLSALAVFEDQDLIDNSMGLIKSEVKLQEIGFFLAHNFMNRHSKTTMWEWMTSNWDWIESKLRDDIMQLSFLPEYSALTMSGSDSLKKYKDFWSTKDIASLTRPVNLGINTITWQSEWKSRDYGTIKDFFAKQSQ